MKSVDTRICIAAMPPFFRQANSKQLQHQCYTDVNKEITEFW